jgi:hypothetical protein
MLLSTTIAACGTAETEPATDEAAATEQPEAMEAPMDEAMSAPETDGMAAADDGEVEQDRGNPIDDAPAN